MGSPEFTNDALNGGDIAESTLGTVPAAAQGGTGRYASQGSCDPESATYVNCAFVPVPLVKPARVLLTAQVEAWTERDSDNGWGGCRLEVNGNPLVSSRTEFAFHDPGEEYTAWNQNSESATLRAPGSPRWRSRTGRPGSPQLEPAAPRGGRSGHLVAKADPTQELELANNPQAISYQITSRQPLDRIGASANKLA